MRQRWQVALAMIVVVGGIGMPARQARTEELRLSEARMRLATHAADIGTYEYDIVRGVGIQSPEFVRIFGLPENAVVETDDSGVPRFVLEEDRHRKPAAQGFQDRDALPVEVAAVAPERLVGHGPGLRSGGRWRLLAPPRARRIRGFARRVDRPPTAVLRR